MEDAADEQRDRSTNMTTTNESDKAKGYLVVDYGDKLKADFKVSHEQIQQQLQHLQREITLLWDIFRNLMILLGPLVIGWIGFFVSRMFLSRMWEGLFVALNIISMSTCFLLFMKPLNKAMFRLIAAFDEFQDLHEMVDQFEDPVTEEGGHGDAGQIDVTENVNFPSNTSDADDVQLQLELRVVESDMEDVSEEDNDSIS